MECTKLEETEQEDIDIVSSDLLSLQRRMDSCQPAFKDKQQARRGSIHIEHVTAKPTSGIRKTPTPLDGSATLASTNSNSNSRRSSYDSGGSKIFFYQLFFYKNCVFSLFNYFTHCCIFFNVS